MEWGILNIGMLFGLAALAIPVLIHLLHRRRHDVVLWGAMQFLPHTIPLRRRRFWDELPLMLLRMGLLALVVFALAEPYSSSAVFAPLAERPARDVVIVVDASYSMGRLDDQGHTPWQEARRWAAEYVEQMGRGERAALIMARRPPVAWQGDLTADRSHLITKIEEMPPPRGNGGLPQALVEAWRLLQAAGTADVKEIILLTDRQHHGWADDATLRQWEALGRHLRTEAESLEAANKSVPRLQVVDVARDMGRTAPNLALGPLVMSRPLIPVGQGAKFTSTLHLHGFANPTLPTRIRVLVDGEPTQEVPLPAGVAAQVPLAFTQRFDKPGQHVVTLALDPGDTPDALAADNEQHAVVEVVAELPVLLVDGDRQLSPESATFFLDKALAAAPGKASAVLPRAVPVGELTPNHILGSPRHPRPRVIVLADVADLTLPQQEAIEAYVKGGGGLLVALGPRVHPTAYNDRFYRQGQGWLPTRLLTLRDESSNSAGARPDLATFQHPALELFRTQPDAGLGNVVLPAWWQVSTAGSAAGAVVARLSSGDPLLIEKVFGDGRVILCTVPADRSRGSPLPSAWEFPVLVHELVYYLAGARADNWRLDDGQPLRVGAPANGSAPGRLIVQTPEVASKTVQVRDWPWTDADTGAIGLYRIEREDGTRQFFVVPPDLGESADRRCTDDEWSRVLRLLPMPSTTGASVESAAGRHDLWWLFLVAVIGLLCSEVYITRRLARARRRHAAG